MKKPKQIIYRYNGDEKSDDVLHDLRGDVEVPQKGSLIERNGRTWKVFHLLELQTMEGEVPIDLYRVFLTEDK